MSGRAWKSRPDHIQDGVCLSSMYIIQVSPAAMASSQIARSPPLPPVGRSSMPD